MKKLLSLVLAMLFVLSVCTMASAEGTYSFITRYADTENITYVFKTLTEEYKKDHPDFDLEINVVPTTDDVILVNAASGDLPDIMLCGYGDTIRTLAAQGMLVDFAELFTEIGVYDTVDANVWEKYSQTYGGPVWALPNSFNVEGFWYNQEMFAEVGVEVPTTMSEFEAVCEKFLAAGIQPVSLAGLDYPPTRWFQNLVQRQMGGEYADKVDAGEVSYTEEACVNALAKLVEWNDKGYFGPGITTVDKNTMLNVFMEGRAAMTYYSTNGTSIFSNGDIQFTMGFFPWFEWEGGVGKRTEMITTYGWIWCVEKAALTDELKDWLAYVMPRFGDTALSGVQLVTPFKTSGGDIELGYYAKLADEAIAMRTGGFNHSGNKMPAAVTKEFQANIQLMFLHELTPEECGKAVDEAFLMNS